MGDKEVHGNVFTVHVLVHHISHLLRLPVGVQVGVDLMDGGGGGGGRDGKINYKEIASFKLLMRPCTNFAKAWLNFFPQVRY